MTISVNCPQCGAAYQFTDDVAGQQGQCTCGTLFTIPPATVVQQPIQPQPIAPAPLDPLAVQPTAPPAPLDPLAVQPTAPPAPVIQPIVPQQPIAGGQQPFIQPVPGGSPVAPQAGAYAVQPGGSSGLLFVGHQLTFWARIGVVTGILCVLIGSLMLASTFTMEWSEKNYTYDDFEGAVNSATTVATIGQWIFIVATIVVLVGFGFFLAMPRSWRVWGLTLATLIVCAVGFLLQAIVFIAKIDSSVMLVFSTILLYSGGIMVGILLLAFSGFFNRPETKGTAITVISLNATTLGLSLLFLILAKNNFFYDLEDLSRDKRESAASTMKWMSILFSLFIHGAWGTAVGMEMLALGKLKRHFN